MAYRENRENINNANNINNINNANNAKPINKSPVGLISSTYDPSRQMSSMQQSLKQLPNTNLPHSPPVLQSYPQPSKNITLNNTSQNAQLNNTTPLNNHPSQSSMKPKGLPVHPNSREGELIRNTQNMKNAQMQNSQTQIQKDSVQDSSKDSSKDSIIQKVSDRIYNHFKLKYPSTIEASGFNKNTIVTIVNQIIKKEPLNEKSIGKIIDIIDHKFKISINSDNRQGVQYDTTAFSIDTESKISIDKYLENYTNKVSILLENSDKAIEANLPKTMAPINESIKIPPPEPFNEDFPIRDRAKHIDMMIPEVREYDYYIVINSNDRNITKNPEANNFIIDFAPAPSGESQPQTGYIDRSFSNIKSCELINVTLLNTSNVVGSTDYVGIKYPYLLLQFDELQSNYFGTNANLSRTFAILTDYSVTGNYRYYKIFGELGDTTVSHIYNPRINLTKLTTRVLLPDGTPFNFGTENISDTSNSCITFGFRITTIQKNLGTSFMNSA